jgi:hypothetical protein
MISLETALEIASNVAIDKYEEIREYGSKERPDRRLRNTKLLLKNYQILLLHCENAIFTRKQYRAYTRRRSVIDILDQLDSEDDKQMYIESIKKSTQRTAIIISHVKNMLWILQTLDERQRYKDVPSRYEVLKHLYIDKDKTHEELAEMFNTSVKTIQRRKDEAIRVLSGLIFGIDNLKMR